MHAADWSSHLQTCPCLHVWLRLHTGPEAVLLAGTGPGGGVYWHVTAQACIPPAQHGVLLWTALPSICSYGREHMVHV